MLTTKQADSLVRILTAMGDPTGQCYVVAEAVWHAFGGKKSGWTPMVMRLPGGTPLKNGACLYAATHWYLRWDADGAVLDPTVAQFLFPIPYYGRGCGFLTKAPSKRAQTLLAKAGLHERRAT